MRELLFLAHRIPYPPNKGDKIRSWHFLAHLAKHWRVHLGCFIDDPDDHQHISALQEVCAETHFADLHPGSAKLRSTRGLLSRTPLSLPYYRDAGLAAWVKGVCGRAELDAVFVYSSAMAQYVAGADLAKCRRIMDFVDVDSDKWRQYAASCRWPKSAIYRREHRALLSYERDVARAFDASILVSPDEAALFRTLAPESAHKIHHVNNGVDFSFFAPDPALADPFDGHAETLVFTGMMNYRPNIDAAEWMARTILPRIRAQRPDARFYVVGAEPTAAVSALAALPGVTVTGRVPDVRPFIAHAAAFVAPLRISRGVQNKVLEGMAMAKAVVATPDAHEGIEAEADRDIAVAGDAASFATTVLSLLADREAAARMGARARERVINSYAWERSFDRLDALFAGEQPPADPPYAEAAQ